MRADEAGTADDIIRIAVIYPEMFITFEGSTARQDDPGPAAPARLGRGPRGRPHARARRHALGEEIRISCSTVARSLRGRERRHASAPSTSAVIRPALARGATVICDHYVGVRRYQGIARGLGIERVLDLNLAAVEG
jgi:hypothetical protein